MSVIFFIAPYDPKAWEDPDDTSPKPTSDLRIVPSEYREKLAQKWREIRFIPGGVLGWELPHEEGEYSGLRAFLQGNQQIVDFGTGPYKSFVDFILWHRSVIPERYRLFLFNSSSWDSLILTGDTTEQDIVHFTGIRPLSDIKGNSGEKILVEEHKHLSLNVLPASLDHPEGVAWGPDGRIYAGGEAGQVYRLNLEDGSAEMFANTNGFVLGLAHDADANVYACDMKRQHVVKVTPAGVVSMYSDGGTDQKMRTPNYPVFDAAGNLYVSDSGDWGARSGFVWRVKPGGAGEIWTREPNGFTNGMCLGPDGKSLYVVESTPPLISRIPILPDGSAGPREIVVELPRTVPDGVAFDMAGNLYISCYNPNIIYRFTTAGKLETLYDDWEQLILIAPTNIAFGGADMKTLLIASLCGWNITTAPMEIAGLRVQYPKLG